MWYLFSIDTEVNYFFTTMFDLVIIHITDISNNAALHRFQKPIISILYDDWTIN